MADSDTDLFQYTAGRWLWNEEKQPRNRYTPSNVSELKRIAAHSIGADTCTAIMKLAEGNYNKCFRLEMDNASTARTILGIPTPRLYDWDADMDNSVVSEYIIMDEASGTMVQEVWEDLPIDDRMQLAQELAELQTKLLQVPLNCYGSLYYATANIQDAVPAETCGEVPPELKDEIRHRFVIASTYCRLKIH
ncbi:hypothetical protein BDQ94DRAFT_161390 [Aspergillus welwitschiae]|uniref:Altered inheritance of mitochondria protein 9, mitochondrial n=1 Tax=Aspergillus welwitschiae TaxID=1341132 RepID=A0A3F3PTR2_9EURO|nr:hypothetical protein BDQ94DRAFT_161390 [Aspergillus welwitschiae]RDH30340.1 hypothetical protein BDQ94DRAFT_161390 [Aspergillus welwitschiae]